MNIKDEGVLKPSRQYFAMTNDFAKKALYYVINSGKYYSTKKYQVKREELASFLFIYIKEGQFYLQYKGRSFIVPENSFIFLDCQYPHMYKANTNNTRFDWFHFSGNSSKEYFDLLYSKNGCVYELYDDHILISYMERIIKMMEQDNMEEHLASIYIQQILYELNQYSNLSNQLMENKIKQAIAFIEDVFQKDIKLDDIANHVYLSPYYFSRMFKKLMDSSPIQYLINYRVNHAKKLLHHTNLSIEEIAVECGFNSTSHFITTFKKNVNISPKQFRAIFF
ncbi:AraC family transcriptional regulator [Oceanobacillus timonensis]|uniref:AraC family transcriptional regulator n=1 Tax=Oceanobacillus timonensis TaxID=1926285 RepID=UPI001FEBDFA6|nr:AraC family transcriptional regulator [Oceanobacillus timonensis]